MSQYQTCPDGGFASTYYGGFAGADYYQNCAAGGFFEEFVEGEPEEPVVLPEGFDPVAAGESFAAAFVIVATCWLIGYGARALLRMLK
jgi:hypothetical protein